MILVLQISMQGSFERIARASIIMHLALTEARKPHHFQSFEKRGKWHGIWARVEPWEAQDYVHTLCGEVLVSFLIKKNLFPG